ncbi:glycosyltransferase [uncultured Polaribacter sp.]|uniref:glycosyltransferase n=1 Tax=uncultured Polaribacter sp. TaxID=174711 RepID=UPI00262BD87E|nr:glycosyltransferase [uncultured Polaribacter sp.]
MKFAIITHAVHKKVNNTLFAYEPYVREMNLWLQYVEKVKVLAPISSEKISEIDEKYNHKNILLLKIPSFNVITFFNKVKSIILIPIIFIKIFKVMLWADHIHLRCPGNIGLLGCFVQILFPNKPKTVKYAGNWDSKSKQPFSYRLQKKIISNTFLTRNCKVLVYGDWKNQSKNIIPFFTASYYKDEVENVSKKELDVTINFIFVGSFSKGKQPLLSVKTVEKLLLKNYDVKLNMYGDGAEFSTLKKYIVDKKLSNNIILHGNQPKEIVKEAFKKSHFLIFISKSEGWPKVVAEAMFWRCLPISSRVSCVDYMLGNGKRGTTVPPNVREENLVKIIVDYMHNKEIYQKKVLAAQKWSQKFNLDTFDIEIKKLLLSE